MTKYANYKYGKDTINNYRSDGYTAIGSACKNNDSNLVKKLLEEFPEINLEKGRKNGLSAIDIARMENNAKVIQHLVSHDPTVLRYTPGTIPKMYCTGLLDILQREGVEGLVNKAIGMQKAEVKGVSKAFKSAVKNPDIEKNAKIISSLSKHVPAYNEAIAPSGSLYDGVVKIPLITAITTGNIIAVQSLYESNCNPEFARANELGQTPLHYAARLGQDKILGFLITKSQSSNPLDIKGYSPLDYALKGKHVTTAALLIKNGMTYSKLGTSEKHSNVLEQAQKYNDIYNDIEGAFAADSADVANDVVETIGDNQLASLEA
jgi:ankyrin repeat protein